MTTRTKATRIASSNVQDTPKSKLLLQKDDWIDALDCEGVWNVARVLSIPSPEEVEIHYENWGNEFDEVIHLSENRIAPFHTFTWSVKCWVKYDNWPWWPALATIRTAGTNDGVRYLRKEKRLLVDSLEYKNLKYRQREWLELRQISPLQVDFADRKAESSGNKFEFSFRTMKKSTADEEFPELDGTLPKKTKFNPAIMTVAAMKKKLGPRWIQLFLDNRKRFDDIFLVSDKPVASRKKEAVSSSHTSDARLKKTRSGNRKSAANRSVPTRTNEKEWRNRPISPKIVEISTSDSPESIDQADGIHRRRPRDLNGRFLKRKRSEVVRELELPLHEVSDSSIKPTRRLAAVRAEAVIAPAEVSLLSPSDEESSEQEFEYGVVNAEVNSDNKAHVIENIDPIQIEIDRKRTHRANTRSSGISQPKPKRRLPVVAAKSSSAAAKPLPTRMKSLPAKIANPELYENIVETNSVVSRAEPKTPLPSKVAHSEDAMLSSFEDQTYRADEEQRIFSSPSIVPNEQTSTHEDKVSSDEIDEWEEARNSSYLQANYVPSVRAQRMASSESKSKNTFPRFHPEKPSQHLENAMEDDRDEGLSPENEMEDVGYDGLRTDYQEDHENQYQECESVELSSVASDNLQSAEEDINEMDHLKSRIFDSPPGKYDDPEVWYGRAEVEMDKTQKNMQPWNLPPQHSFISAYAIARGDTLVPLACLESHPATASDAYDTDTIAEIKISSVGTSDKVADDLNGSIQASPQALGNTVQSESPSSAITKEGQITNKIPEVFGLIPVSTNLEIENPKSHSSNVESCDSLDSNEKVRDIDDSIAIVMENCGPNETLATTRKQADAIDDGTIIPAENQFTECPDSINIQNPGALPKELARTVDDKVVDGIFNDDSSTSPNVAASMTTKAVFRTLDLSAILSDDPAEDAEGLIKDSSPHPFNETSEISSELSSSAQKVPLEETLPTEEDFSRMVSESGDAHINENNNEIASDNQQNEILTSATTVDSEDNGDKEAIALLSNSVELDSQKEIDDLLSQELDHSEDVSQSPLSENKDTDKAVAEIDHEEDTPEEQAPSCIVDNSVVVEEHALHREMFEMKTRFSPDEATVSDENCNDTTALSNDLEQSLNDRENSDVQEAISVEMKAADKNELTLLPLRHESIEETLEQEAMPDAEDKSEQDDEVINELVEEPSASVDEPPVVYLNSLQPKVTEGSIKQNSLVVNQAEDTASTQTQKVKDFEGTTRSKQRRSRNMRSTKKQKSTNSNPGTNMGFSRPYVFMMHTDNRSIGYDCVEIEEPIKLEIPPRSLAPNADTANQDLGKISHDEALQATDFSIEKWFMQSISSVSSKEELLL